MLMSLYAIVRDEETALPGMIESVKGVADEMVIVDTGSTDRTVEIARELGATVFTDYTWNDDFAAARNSHIDDCTGDWILVLDADERLAEASRDTIKSCLSAIGPEFDLLLCSMDMCRDDWTVYQCFQAERILRGGKGIRWVGAMHNWIDIEQDRRICNPNIHILHNRGVKDGASRAKRAEQRMQIADKVFPPQIESGEHDRRAMFYYAGTLFDTGQFEKAKEWFEKYMPVSDWGEERYQGGYLLSQCYCRENAMDKARRVASEVLADNWRRAECYIVLGQIAYQAGRYDEAEWWFKVASLKPEPVDPLFVERDAHTWEPFVNLWMTYKAMGDNQKAAESGRKAVELGATNSGEIVRWEKAHTIYEDQKIAVLVDRGQRDFIEPLIEHWKSQDKQVEETADPADVDRVVSESDMVFCEWAGELAVKATNLPKHGRIVVRIHGYELNTDYLERINWATVDDCVFVSRTLKDQCCERVPIHLWCNCYVVPGGVETGKFTVGEGKAGTKIAMLGYVNQRKNIPLALQILAALPKEYSLHLAGEWQDAELMRYVQHLGDELQLEGRLFIYGRVEDANEFFADKDYILSTSIRETMQYSIAEGMAAGLMPVVHDWQSASDFYPEKNIFRTVEEAAALITGEPGKPEEWRNYAIENLDISRNLRRIDRIVNRPSISVLGQPKTPWANEYRFEAALQSLGCITDNPEPDAVLLMGQSVQVPKAPGKKIAFCVEQIVGNEDHQIMRRQQILPTLVRSDVVYTHLPEAVPMLQTMGLPDVRFATNIHAHEPYRDNRLEKTIDVGFCGYMSEHRKAILDRLGEKLDITTFENPDSAQVNEFYNRCKIVLNLHVADTPNIEGRVGEAMAAGACVVSEPLAPGHTVPAECFIETDDLEGEISRLLSDDSERERLAKTGHSWVWKHSRLEQNVEKLMEELGV